MFFENPLKSAEKFSPAIRTFAQMFAAAMAMLLFLTVSTSASATPAATVQGVLRTTLPNGLRVVIVRNTLAPVVATSVNYLTGAVETPPGFPRTAPADEHMMILRGT